MAPRCGSPEGPLLVETSVKGRGVVTLLCPGLEMGGSKPQTLTRALRSLQGGAWSPPTGRRLELGSEDKYKSQWDI